MAEDAYAHLLDLLFQVKNAISEYAALEESNQENMERIDGMRKVLFERMRTHSEENDSRKEELQKRVMELEEEIANKDREIANLTEERDDYSIELSQLNNALKLLIVDHKNLEDEKELKEGLLSEIQQLEDTIAQKENVIAQLQEENGRIRSEKAMILEEVAKAVQDDEQSIAADDSSYSREL